MQFTRHRIRIIGIFLALALAVGGIWFQYFRPDAKKVDGIHYHAAFVVYLNDQRVDFSAAKYMNLENCAADAEEESTTPEHEQKEKAHLHDGVGDVVHVHRDGAVWGDLFTNLPYEFTEDALKVVRADGTDLGFIYDAPIVANDRVAILIGASTDLENKLTSIPSVSYIRDIEKRSETCGT